MPCQWHRCEALFYGGYGKSVESSSPTTGTKIKRSPHLGGFSFVFIGILAQFCDAFCVHFDRSVTQISALLLSICQ
jgi:hypothetical protein